VILADIRSHVQATYCNRMRRPARHRWFEADDLRVKLIVRLLIVVLGSLLLVLTSPTPALGAIR
jgi:hypothetical protein